MALVRRSTQLVIYFGYPVLLYLYNPHALSTTIHYHRRWAHNNFIIPRHHKTMTNGVLPQPPPAQETLGSVLQLLNIVDTTLVPIARLLEVPSDINRGLLERGQLFESRLRQVDVIGSASLAVSLDGSLDRLAII